MQKEIYFKKLFPQTWEKRWHSHSKRCFEGKQSTRSEAKNKTLTRGNPNMATLRIIIAVSALSSNSEYQKETFYTSMLTIGNLEHCQPNRICHKRNVLWPEANPLYFLLLLKLFLLLKWQESPMKESPQESPIKESFHIFLWK